MKVRKILTFLLLMAIAAWGIQSLYILHGNVSNPSQIKKQAETERVKLMLKFQNRQRKLSDEYSQKKYLATGKTVYDRIFNTKDQTLVELIKRMSAEAFPDDWNCEVKVEEFTHFALLVYLPSSVVYADSREIISYVVPIVKYCGSYLNDIAIFNYKHKCYMFFDNSTLKHIEKEESITDTLFTKIRQQGESFTRFNSTTIQCKKLEGHLLLPIEITGTSGIEICIALFDTGASVTTISHTIVSKTGHDDLSLARRKTFDTANGRMTCPIVYREVNIGGLSKRIEVAVNLNDEINLLGMNYFKGMKYIVDFPQSCIYVWDEKGN